MGLRLPEVLIILVVLVLVFGANKIPQLGDALGKGIRNFKKSTEGEDEPPPQAKAQPVNELPAQAPGQGVPASKQTVTTEHKQS